MDNNVYVLDVDNHVYVLDVDNHVYVLVPSGSFSQIYVKLMIFVIISSRVNEIDVRFPI